jgi:hypothetical protein
VSNSNLRATFFDLGGPRRSLTVRFVDQANEVRLNNSSTQVYMALKPRRDDRRINRRPAVQFNCAASSARTCCSAATLPAARTRFITLGRVRARGRVASIVSSTNARFEDWSGLIGRKNTKQASSELVETTFDALEKYVPNCAGADRSRRSRHSASHSSITPNMRPAPASGPNSRVWRSAAALPEQIRGLYHAGSVGIIMSGWLGAINYGVIVANSVDGELTKQEP